MLIGFGHYDDNLPPRRAVHGLGRFDAGGTIFGNVAHGVPNSFVPHLSPWPTRYHGSAFMYPDARRQTYVEQAYQVPYPDIPPGPGLGAVNDVEPARGHVNPQGSSTCVVGGGFGIKGQLLSAIRAEVNAGKSIAGPPQQPLGVGLERYAWLAMPPQNVVYGPAIPSIGQDGQVDGTNFFRLLLSVIDSGGLRAGCNPISAKATLDQIFRTVFGFGPDSRLRSHHIPTYREVPDQRRPTPVAGLGDVPPLFASASGSNLVDGILGAVAGFAIARPADRPAMAAVGAVAAFVAGTAGILGTLGIGVYTRRKEI